MKGQWFIISAVVASGIFLGMSLALKDYFVIDASSLPRINNDFYFYNIQNQLDRILATTSGNDSPACTNLTANVNEFKALVERALAGKGLLVNINYTSLSCAPNSASFNFLVASHDEIIYNFTTLENASQLIG